LLCPGNGNSDFKEVDQTLKALRVWFCCQKSVVLFFVMSRHLDAEGNNRQATVDAGRMEGSRQHHGRWMAPSDPCIAQGAVLLFHAFSAAEELS
jgi:hypothetical protein